MLYVILGRVKYTPPNLTPELLNQSSYSNIHEHHCPSQLHTLVDREDASNLGLAEKLHIIYGDKSSLLNK